jgi:hypothetical protein
MSGRQSSTRTTGRATAATTATGGLKAAQGQIRALLADKATDKREAAAGARFRHAPQAPNTQTCLPACLLLPIACDYYGLICFDPLDFVVYLGYRNIIFFPYRPSLRFQAQVPSALYVESVCESLIQTYINEAC